MAKTVCPISTAEFLAKAEALTLRLGVDGPVVAAAPRQFSTGSVGWGANCQATMLVDGVAVACMVSVNITAVGSKPTA